VGEEIDGAMCLLETEQGFEVFLAAGGARHELQTFATEEAACFYLFGVLAAEEVRRGALARAEVSRAGLALPDSLIVSQQPRRNPLAPVFGNSAPADSDDS
jgi:hypothetical protein